MRRHAPTNSARISTRSEESHIETARGDKQEMTKFILGSITGSAITLGILYLIANYPW
jgi:hypothetical protein